MSPLVGPAGKTGAAAVPVAAVMAASILTDPTVAAALVTGLFTLGGGFLLHRQSKTETKVSANDRLIDQLQEQWTTAVNRADRLEVSLADMQAEMSSLRSQIGKYEAAVVSLQLIFDVVDSALADDDSDVGRGRATTAVGQGREVLARFTRAA